METSQFIHLKNNESTFIYLRDLTSSGYVWKVYPEFQETVKIDRIWITGREINETSIIPGGGNQIQYMITAVALGREHIEFRLEREWGKSDPVENHSIEIRVD